MIFSIFDKIDKIYIRFKGKMQVTFLSNLVLLNVMKALWFLYFLLMYKLDQL